MNHPTKPSSNGLSHAARENSDRGPKISIHSRAVLRVIPSCAKLTSSAREYHPETWGSGRPGNNLSKAKNAAVEKIVRIVGNVISSV